MNRYDPPHDTKSGSQDFAERAVDAGFRAADAVGTAVSRVQDTGEQLMGQGAELGDNIQKVAGNFSRAIDKSLTQQPMTTLGMALAAGFILGALWKA